MRLLHLTAVGADKPPASVPFAPRLTVIYGASEAGKSYIIDALNFMLGARALRDIPEAAGYQTMLLGIEMASGNTITLARDLRGGRVMVFDEDLRSSPARPPDRSLAAQHVTGSEDTVSHYLLRDLDLAGAQVRKNERNNLQALGIRNLMRLSLVDEERILARRSPVESDVPMARTADRSVFKLMLEGSDDSDLIGGEDPARFRRVNRGQVEVLDRALSQLYERLGDVPERPALLDQLARLNVSIDDTSRSIADALGRRDELVDQRDVAQEDRRRSANVVVDARTVGTRFALLDQKYTSDLERLEMVREVGTFLGYFQAGTCVLCGAAPEHQHPEHAIYESGEVSTSVDAEVAKTTALQSDLAETIARINDEEARANARVSQARAEIQRLTDEIATLEQDVRPGGDEISRLLLTRSDVERSLTLWVQVDELSALRASVAGEQPAVADAVAEGISSKTQRDFSRTVAEVLQQWGVPGSSECYVSFDGAPDVVLEQRRRIDRGKGMRSILHAGFVIALGEYCLERELPHPGFVVLDTPVLTYRDAEQRESASGDELLSVSVAESFYAYLEGSYIGQSIVLENQTPPEVTGDGCSVMFFSGTPGVGRSGFFPE